MKSPPRSPTPARGARLRSPTLVVSNLNVRPFTYYLSQAQSMLRNHGSVKLSGVGGAMQHALVVSEVLSARGLGRVAAVRTSTLAGAEEDSSPEHSAKIEVTFLASSEGVADA
jgi:hypothetical protein